MEPDKTSELTEEQHLADIFRRIELGDTSVADDVYWLQLREDFLNRKPGD